MSRRLDALFAERVLGCKPAWQAVDGPNEAPLCQCGNYSHGYGACLPHYTTDLSVAWEGVEHILDKDSNATFSLLAHYWSKYEARFRFKEIGESAEGHTNDDSPAFAIVLACLRAVGVSEEKIKEAQNEK